MSYLSVSGFSCVRGRVLLPRVGVWVADVVIEPTSAAGSPPSNGQRVIVSLNGALSLSGTVRRAQNAFGVVMARIVGGGGGFPTDLQPKAYQGVPLRIPLTDLLSTIGEQLSAQSSQADLTLNLATWVRPAGLAFRAMLDLVGETSDNWRVLPDGTVWLGPETWPPSGMAYSLMAYEPQELKMAIYSDNPTILPGQALSGGAGYVSSVEHIVEPDRVRSTLLFEDPELLRLEAA